MKISLAVISCCDALLLFSEGHGANREKIFIEEMWKPIYYTLDQIKGIK